MGRRCEIITFDCYGTLVDWEVGISRAFGTAAEEAGVALGRPEILAAHAAIEPRVQAETFRSYREVLIETAHRMALGFGWDLDRSRSGFLADSLPDWAVFEDTNEALGRLRDAGYRLGILSNVDKDLLDATMSRLDVEFECVVTAQQVRSYKPADPHFLAAREAIGGDRWLHAAQSWFHDIVPATRLGIRSAWINRNRDERGEDGRPEHEFRDLAGLADVFCRGS